MLPLVEVITTAHTSKATVATALQFAKTLGKTPIIVKDSCGFLVNRILLGYINEAGRCLVMQANIEGEEVSIVLLNSFGKLTPFGDSNRLRKWMLASS